MKALIMIMAISLATAFTTEQTFSYQQYAECRAKALKQIRKGATNSETTFCIPPQGFYKPKYSVPKKSRRVGRAN
jgi:hypothetical protein